MNNWNDEIFRVCSPPLREKERGRPSSFVPILGLGLGLGLSMSPLTRQRCLPWPFLVRPREDQLPLPPLVASHREGYRTELCRRCLGFGATNFYVYFLPLRHFPLSSPARRRRWRHGGVCCCWRWDSPSRWWFCTWTTMSSALPRLYAVSVCRGCRSHMTCDEQRQGSPTSATYCPAWHFS